ncbi:MAG: hypothetical protein KDD11_19065, partial [Acidobacteria bacterium]|nr:hypothetical protein [Acidobacteriota bacterium]
MPTHRTPEVSPRASRRERGAGLLGPAAGLLVAGLGLFLPTLPAAAAGSAPPFTEVAAASGLDFVHFNGMSGEYYFPEMTGQGGALFDYDGDGDLDLY